MSLGARRLHSVRRRFEGGVRRGERPTKLFYNLEDSPLAVARGRTGKQRANSLNGLTGSANDTANIPASKLQFKDSRPAAWNFCQRHIVGKFNQLPNDELEEFSHS